MALSKSAEFVQEIMMSYFQQLYLRPLRTKSLTSCCVMSLANLTAQYISGAKMIDQDSVIAFGIYGLLFGGSIPHFFYKLLDYLIPYNSRCVLFKQMFIERILFTPFYQYFALYMISRFQGMPHKEALAETSKLYWTMLKSNLHIMTIIQFINFKYVHPQLRVLIGNLVGFFWVIYFAYKKQAAAKLAAAEARKKKITPAK